MTIATRGMGAPCLLSTFGLGNYGEGYVPPVEPESKEGSGGGGISYQQAIKRFMPHVTRLAEQQTVDIDRESIAPKQLIKALPKDLTREAVKAIKRELGVMAPEARELLALRARKQLAAMRELRLEIYNDEAIALLLIAIGLDDER